MTLEKHCQLGCVGMAKTRPTGFFPRVRLNMPCIPPTHSSKVIPLHPLDSYLFAHPEEHDGIGLKGGNVVSVSTRVEAESSDVHSDVQH